MNQPNPGGSHQHDATEASDQDREWLRKIRANPHTHLIFRVVVGVVGLFLVVLGLILVPFPGPGWAVVFAGLFVWSLEFIWAQRLLRRARGTLQVWNEWFQPQPWWVKVLVLLFVGALVAAFFWLLFAASGVPTFFPDTVENWLSKLPGLSS